MVEQLTYYAIIPWRTIQETHIYSDNPNIISWDEDKIVMKEPNSRDEGYAQFIYHRKKEPLIEKMREAFYRDIRIAQENLEEFEKKYK